MKYMKIYAIRNIIIIICKIVDIFMGNSKTKIGLHLQLQKNIYLPGQLVQGCVYVNAPSAYPAQKILLTVKGYEKSWWKASTVKKTTNKKQNPTSNQSMKPYQGIKPSIISNIPDGDRMGESKIIQTSYVLNHFGDSSTLKGQYAFPFQFNLPMHIPGSFKQQKNDYKASIEYIISCQLFSSKKPADNITLAHQLVIRQPKKQNQQSLFGQIYLYPESCCCCKQGVSRVCCYFQKNQYIPGQECVAICEADNYKSSLNIREIKVKFKKVLTLTSGFGEQNTFVKQINEASFPGIHANGQYVGQHAKKIKIALKYSNTDTPIHPSTNGRLVKCQYFLEVSPVLSGWFVKNVTSFHVKLNILQEGHPEVKVEQPQNWNPQVYRKSQIILNENFSNDFIDQMGNKNYF